MACIDWADRLGAKHIALLVVLVVYSLLGAYMFVALEREHDLMLNNVTYTHNMQQPHRRRVDRRQITTRLSELALGLSRSALSVLDVDAQVDDALDWYEEDIYGDEWNTTQQPVDTQWDIWGGLYYAGTIYTTIGYGNIYCVTTKGRVATMLYAIIGIPLTITILSDWGTLLYTAMLAVWNWVLHLWRAGMKKKREKMNGEEEEHHEEEGKAENVPLLATLLMLVVWICLCAALFCLSEDWTYFESVYFFFISLTTIGFGDIYPEDKKFTCAAFLLVMFGLSFVSMAINVIQASMDAAFEDFMAVINDDFKNKLAAAEEEGDVDRESVGEGAAHKEDGEKVDDEKDAEADKPKERPKAGLGVMQLQKGQSWGRRIMLALMGNHKRAQLAAKYEQLANLRNSGSQATPDTADEEVQVSMLEPINADDWMSKSFAEKKAAIAQPQSDDTN